MLRRFCKSSDITASLSKLSRAIFTKLHRVLGTCGISRWGGSNEYKTKSSALLGDAPWFPWRAGVSRVCQLWSQIHQRLCNNGKSLNGTYQERCTFQWGPMQCKVFQVIKDVLYIAPILQYPNPSKPFVVLTDACGKAVECVLMIDPGNRCIPSCS